jgi:outer membrane receptor for ferrienterochelin and colicin
MPRKIVLTLLLSMFGVLYVFAGNTGKIAGKIVDSKSKEPIIGASVLIDGTVMGAASDLDGNFNILNVPPGTYTLKVSAVGYGNSTRKNVKVSIDLTTREEFQLVESTVQTEEVVIVAEKPMVTKDLTASTAVVSADQLQALPVTEFSQVLNLQAGYVGGHVRGGRKGEVGYWIDGIPVTDVYDGGNVVEVNKDMIQELQMISGAFNAEYGQSMSAIVNIATKDGGDKLKGTISSYFGDYLSNGKDIFKRIDEFSPTAIRNFEGSLSGPVLGGLNFYLTGRYIYFGGFLNGIRAYKPNNVFLTDAGGNLYLSRDESGIGDSATVPMNWSERIYGQAKLNYRISPMMKLSYSLILDRTDYQDYDRLYQYNPDGNLNRFSRSYTNILQLSHSVSANTFYNVGLSYFIKDYKHYLYEDPNDPRYCHPNLLQQFSQYYFYVGGTNLSRFSRETQTMLGKFDLTSQITQSHMIKAGFEARMHQLKFEDITLRPVESQSNFNPFTSSPFIQTQILDESSIYTNRYTKKPVEFSGYIQDKMEFKSLIINIGIRVDYFNAKGKTLNDETDPNIFNPIKPWNRFHDLNNNGIQDAGEADMTLQEREAYWYKDTKAKIQVSPRFGASFPITDRGIIHFSYGYFFQIPRFEYLYQNPFFKLGTGTGNVGVIGNADLKPEQTINGEVGLQQQLTEDISIDLTGYFRDIRDLSGTRADEIVVFGGGSSYNKLVNSDFGFIRGIILSLNKRFSGGLSATFDYTLQVARGSASDPQETRNALAGGQLPEVQLTALSWDQRHTANATLTYFNNGWGGSVIAQYGSGQPYTPRRSEDVTSLLTNSQIKPSFFNVDVRFHREIKFGGVNATVYARVFNVFDIRNETGVYDDTGRAGFTTDEARIIRSAGPGTASYIHDWFTNASYYSEPRRIEVGFTIEF